MKNYETYQPGDFLLDDGFVEWIKNPDMDNEYAVFWNNWAKNNPQKIADIEAAKIIYQTITAEETVPLEAKTKVWGKLQTSIISEIQANKTKTPVKSIRMTILKVAASVVLLLGLGSAIYFGVQQFVNDKQLVTVENQRSTPSTVLLADGSSVILYPNSFIEFPEIFDDRFREVHISGKAFFEVAKNKEKPFLVHSAHLYTKVLGTSFLVEDIKQTSTANVAVIEGTVAVYSDTDNENEIKNGELGAEIITDKQAVYFNTEKAVFIRKDFNEQVYSSFNFIDTPVLHVFDLFEEVYGIKIVVDRDVLTGCSLNASLTDMPFQKKIELICKAINYKYKFENNTVILEGSGCK